MKSLPLILILIVLIGCSIPMNKNYVRPVPPALEPEIKETTLDPTNDIQEIMMIIGTDDPLFETDATKAYQDSVNLWALEISKTIKTDFVVFMSHGHSYEGMWICENGTDNYQPLDLVVFLIRKSLPDTAQKIPIILLVCNPWGYDILIDNNVWYAKQNIYLVPTQYLSDEVKQYRENDKVTVDSFDKFINSNNLY